MSPRNDDLFDTIGGDAMDDALAAFVDELRGLAHGPVPVPSAELAMLLGHWPPVASRRRPSLTVVGAVAASVLIVLGGAAGQHALPEPAQSVVSHVVDRLTPSGLGTLDHPVLPGLGPQRPAMHHVGAPAVRIVATHPHPHPHEPQPHAKPHPAAHVPGGHPGRGHDWKPHLAARTVHQRQPHYRVAGHHWSHQDWPHQVRRQQVGPHHYGSGPRHWPRHGTHRHGSRLFGHPQS
jgi:hypothetical protein